MTGKHAGAVHLFAFEKTQSQIRASLVIYFGLFR